MDGRYVRGRAFNLSLLATAHAAQGEAAQACAVGRQAVDLTARLTLRAASVMFVILFVGSGRKLMFRRSGISWRRCRNGCLPQQGMLHADDGDCADDVPSGDHRGCLVKKYPLNLGGLISVGLADVVGSMGQVQVLRIVGVADNWLAGQDVLKAFGAPASLLKDFACRCASRIFAVVDVTAGKFPDPAVNDEPVAPHEQHALAAVIEDCGHGAAAHSENVLGELHSVG
jgi:hypothetical protein